MKNVEGFEPVRTLDMQPGPMRLLDSGWAVSRRMNFTTLNHAGVCLQRETSLFYFYWRTNDKITELDLRGTLQVRCKACGGKLRAESVQFLVCMDCGGESKEIASPLVGYGVTEDGKIELGRHRDLAMQRLELHAGGLLDGEMWALDLESHLGQLIHDIDLYRANNA